MWQTLLRTGLELGRRGRGGRLICPLVGLVAAGAIGLWAAWKARQAPAKPCSREETPPSAGEPSASKE